MAFLAGFGKYLPERVVTNADLAARLGCEEAWIRDVSGIAERRWARADETVAGLAAAAARDCVKDGPAPGMLLVASGTGERRFPGPAAEAAATLGWTGIPALDVPMASAGSLFGLALAAQLAPAYGSVLVVGAEKMSPLVDQEPMAKDTGILFGDGAGAVLVRNDAGRAKVLDALLASDGTFANELRLDAEGLFMNGRAVILQASRKIPRGILDLLARNHVSPGEVDAFVMHQANQNLIDKVAQTVGVPAAKFFTNIARYGNTSSASMLIAAAEWDGFRAGAKVVFAGFGAGFHWGAVLAEGC